MFSRIQKQVKIFNIDALRLSNLLDISIRSNKDNRFSFTKDKDSASFVLKDPYKNLVPNLNNKQYSNTIHNMTLSRLKSGVSLYY